MKKTVLTAAALLLSLMVFIGCDSTPEQTLPEGIIRIEAESTSSPLGNWIRIAPGDSNYIADAGGEMHLEFTSNTINGGDPDSPLEYPFQAPYDGTYRLLIHCHKRLEGYPGDKCNDGWVYLKGDFESGNDVPVKDLKSEEKFFGGTAVGWGWAEKLDWQGHIKRPALYNLKQDEDYTLVISGRSIRWNIDYIVFYDTLKFELDSVKVMLDPGSLNVDDTISRWKYDIDGFIPAYYDKDRKAFAINTVKQPADQWAAAEHTFHRKNGLYTITFTSLLESDGECDYKLLVDGKEYMACKNPRIHGTSTKEYAPHVVTVESVPINRGSVVQVQFRSHSNALVPEGDGFGYARARWREPKFKLKKEL